ncbi:MAG TPA: type II secretion system F family protein [Ramlibacter sp.]|nr:type II secretion system F family protein [Ramlibacter sp.]
MLLPILVFAAVTFALVGLYLWFMPTRAEQRLQASAATQPQGATWTETIVKITGPLAGITAPEGDWDRSPLRVRFLNAGIRRDDARLVFFGLKAILPLVFAAGAFFMLRSFGAPSPVKLLMYVCNAALVGCYLPNIVLHFKAKARQREIFENFPDAADLMLVCVEAGLGLDASLTRVGDEMRRKSVALAEELHLTTLEMRAGGSREKALRNLAVRTGVEETNTFATMLTQADRFGTSIGESLRVFSEDLRHKRMMRAEEIAAKVPTKMLFPLVLCIFPSIIMVILGPSIIQIARTVMPLLGMK